MKALVLLIAAALSAAAQPESIELDPARTEIRFTLGDVLHTVHGTFKLKRGSLRIDPGTGTASGEIVVDVSSGNTGGGARDKRMHKEILESAQFPEATFTPDRVEGHPAATGDSSVRVHGTLTIHGAPHKLTLPVEIHATAGHAIADTHFTVPYVEWGMKNPSNFILKVNTKVEVEIHAAVK